MTHRLDVIGDVHGEWAALQAVGRKLGYEVEDCSWSHPDGRIPVFLGDLVDRGADSLKVAELVMRLVESRRAFCIMGNHEYNLVAWYSGWMGPKESNKATTREVERSPKAWENVLDFFRSLPLAVELPDLRIMHACWHRRCFARVEPCLRPLLRSRAPAANAFEWLEQHVVLASPFTTRNPLKETRLRRGLQRKTGRMNFDPPHEVLMKGYEVRAEEPFQDMDGKTHEQIRAMWWSDGRRQTVPHSAQVFGHYGGIPPVNGETVPSCATGHPDMLALAHRMVNRASARNRDRVFEGTAAMAGDLVCVDFHGVTAVSEKACIGALRWPERKIVWASANKTAETDGRIEGFKRGLDWFTKHAQLSKSGRGGKARAVRSAAR